MARKGAGKVREGQGGGGDACQFLPPNTSHNQTEIDSITPPDATSSPHLVTDPTTGLPLPKITAPTYVQRRILSAFFLGLNGGAVKGGITAEAIARQYGIEPMNIREDWRRADVRRRAADAVLVGLPSLCLAAVRASLVWHASRAAKGDATSTRFLLDALQRFGALDAVLDPEAAERVTSGGDVEGIASPLAGDVFATPEAAATAAAMLRDALAGSGEGEVGETG